MHRSPAACCLCRFSLPKKRFIEPFLCPEANWNVPDKKIHENISSHHKTKTPSAEAGARMKKRKLHPRSFRIGFHFYKYFHSSLDLLAKCGSDSPDFFKSYMNTVENAGKRITQPL